LAVELATLFATVLDERLILLNGLLWWPVAHQLIIDGE
jgi:hypothetical protein